MPHFKDFLLYLNMTKTQIQSEIQKVLDSVPESVLQDVLDFLKELQDQPAEKVRLTNNLRQILSEDKDLLERLAQ
jgi:mRNA-degrading endonuclease RelE of RelBE toxin-antitoxin system